MPNLKISLVIPAHNEEKYIGACLQSAQKHAGDFCEIIVINNASTDKTAEVAKNFPGVRVVDEPQKGLTKARQRGLMEAGGDIVAYIDADCRLPSRWFETVFKEFNSNPNLVALSGPYRYYDLPHFQKFIAELGWWAAPPIYRAVGYMILGGNFAAKKNALQKMGGFDAAIDFYGEDTDIARRLSPFGKILFRMDFFVHSSGRRLQAEGLLKTFLVYGVNFLWEIFYGKPFTKHYQDVR
ncbi:MAG: glycosyltransferase family A protein [Candidatus Giovannonibacteria bacterium]|nr:glycosyltransferase family A protein [Candidatus Giovannonibacteria bacterium]